MAMLTQDQIDFLKSKLPYYAKGHLQPSKGGMYVCPICGSGSGPNKTGAFSVKGPIWTCFSCGKKGDLFDLIGEVEQLPGKAAQFARARELYLSENPHPAIYPPQHAPASQVRAAGAGNKNKNTQEDYTAYYESANKNLTKTAYHRGISLETLNRFKVGFDETWKHPKCADNPKVQPSPRLIIPCSKWSYLARDTTGTAQIPKMRVGNACLFNVKALKDNKGPIFITEGELDALSLIDLGVEAVALGSANNTDLLIDAVKRELPSYPLVLALDNDEAGQNAGERLIRGFDDLGMMHAALQIDAKFKDANAALIGGREDLQQAVDTAKAKALELYSLQAQDYRQRHSTARAIVDFMGDLAKGVDTPFISTGFANLDRALDGGLYEGLFVLGAISSLGKTTFVLQMAEQIAGNGQDVLIISLEMARNELISKSLSRLTFQISKQEGKIIHGETAKEIYPYGRSTREITCRWLRDYLTENDTEVASYIAKAGTRYQDYADHIFIQEGIGDLGADQIRNAVLQHKRHTGAAPVVIVDYLQILAPYNERATDKQNTDKAVLELKRLSRDFKIPVIAISSFNRSNYSNVVTMEAFKESGAIEYSSDVLIGLQLSGVGSKDFDAESAKSAEPRKIELKILKNRNGKINQTCLYDFYPRFNCFEE